MKKITILLIFIAAFFLSGCEKEPLVLSDFTITQSTHDYKTDWEQIVRDEFGDDYKVADWKDLVRFHEEGGDLLDLFDNLGLTAVGSDVTVKYKGVKNYEADRGYYATRHEHNKPAGYLAHDDIDNYLISLGSWSGSRKIMAIKK
jgi:hypothetical protein